MSEILLDHRQLDITFTVDGDVAPIFVESGKLVIRESMERLVPSGEIWFRDFKSVFMADYPFVQDSEMGITMQDDDATKVMNFRPFSDSGDQIGNTDNYDFKLNIISTYADKVLTFSEFHSKRCKASDYIKYLADRLGLEYDVEESKDVRNIIIPSWKVGQTLRWLASTSISASGSSGYMYYVTYDGKLTFKTIDKFFDDETEPETINLAYDLDPVQGVVVKRSHFSTMLLGANYREVLFYDLNDSEFSSSEIPYNKFVKKRALKYNVPVKFAKEGGKKYSNIFYSDDGKPLDYEKSIFKKALIYADSNKLIITVKANPFGRKLGNIVNVNMPIEAEDTINIPLSGRYLIKTIVTKGFREFWQTLVLVRPGINYAERSDLL